MCECVVEKNCRMMLAGSGEGGRGWWKCHVVLHSGGKGGDGHTAVGLCLIPLNCIP